MTFQPVADARVYQVRRSAPADSGVGAAGSERPSEVRSDERGEFELALHTDAAELRVGVLAVGYHPFELGPPDIVKATELDSKNAGYARSLGLAKYNRGI